MPGHVILLKADGQIIITIVCLLVSLVAWGIRLEGQVETTMLRLEEHLLFVDKQIVLIRRDIERLEDKQSKFFNPDDQK